MKSVQIFNIKSEIPTNAKFLFHKYNNTTKDHELFYEVPIKVKTSNKSKESDKETLETINRVIKYLNAKTGSKFTSKAKAHASKIRARINEGATPEQFKECIDNMCTQWLDDNRMRPYLRPETLFSNKFWGYITAKSGEQMTQDAFDELDQLISNVGEDTEG